MEQFVKAWNSSVGAALEHARRCRTWTRYKRSRLRDKSNDVGLWHRRDQRLSTKSGTGMPTRSEKDPHGSQHETRGLRKALWALLQGARGED